MMSRVDRLPKVAVGLMLCAGMFPVHADAAPLRSLPAVPMVRDAADTTGALDLRAARLAQQQTKLLWQIGTTGPWSSSILRQHPERSLCVQVTPHSGGARARRVCVKYARTGRSRLRAVAQVISSGTAVIRSRSLPAVISRTGANGFSVRFAPEDAWLAAGAYDWHVTSSFTDAGTCSSGCTDLVPDTGTSRMRIWKVHIGGCVPQRPLLRTDLATTSKVIALTFDDGPTETTSGFISTLHRYNAVGTFFVLGQQARHYPSLLRRAIAGGNAIGNHSYSHRYMTADTPRAHDELTRTSQAIEQATGFRPCLYRPPYGARGTGIQRVAWRLGMMSILWDVDPEDWRNPSASQIRNHILSHAHPGSIMLMHDGAAGRRSTLAALPGIITTLHARGYRLVTVPDLLGLAPAYTYTRS